MTISDIFQKMLVFSEGSFHDINHLIKVWTYARTIGRMEGLDEETLFILEAASIVHDIACPSLRSRYGHADGKLQEEEGPALVREFFRDTDLTQDEIERIAYLVGHHHTITNVDGIDYRILLEADYLVNAEESAFSRKNIVNACGAFFRTGSGRELLGTLYFPEKTCSPEISRALPEEEEEVYHFYNAVMDSLGKDSYCWGWRKDVYPDRAMLSSAIEEGTLFIGRFEGILASAMVLNHKPNESYRDCTWEDDFPDDRVSILHLLAAHPIFQRKGLAGQMVSWAEEYARENGDRAIRLDVLKGNLPAEKLYRKMGFLYQATLPMYYVDTGWTEFLLYQKKL